MRRGALLVRFFQVEISFTARSVLASGGLGVTAQSVTACGGPRRGPSRPGHDSVMGTQHSNDTNSTRVKGYVRDTIVHRDRCGRHRSTKSCVKSCAGRRSERRQAMGRDGSREEGRGATCRPTWAPTSPPAAPRSGERASPPTSPSAANRGARRTRRPSTTPPALAKRRRT